MSKAILISIKPKYVADILNHKKTIEVRKSMPKCDLPIDVYIYCTKEKPYLFESDWSDNEGRLCPVPTELKKAIEYVKSKPHYGKEYNGCPFVLYGTPYGNLFEKRKYYSGKVVAKFTLNKVVPIVMQMGANYGYGNNGYVGYGHCEKDNFKFMFDMEKETCLEHDEELCKYLNNGKNFDDIYINKLKANNGYAWHISNLIIFDKPKELSEFKILKRAKAVDCFRCDTYLLTEMCIGKRCLLSKPLTKAPQSWCYVEI